MRGNDVWLPIAVTAAVVSGVCGSIAMALAKFAIGGALLALSILLLRWPRSIWSDGGTTYAPARKWILLTAVVGVAAFFRFHRLNPPGLWGDDALNGLIAFNVLDGHIRSPFEIITHSHSRFHALSNYAVAASFWLFGADLATLRLPGIVANLACVPILYALAAPLFGARVALVAAFFFATSPFQISHAKGLVQNVLGATFQIAGLCLLVRGLTSRRHGLAVAAAVPLALCVYTYHSAKIAPLVALPYYFAAALETPRPRRRIWLVGLFALLVLGLSLVPAYLSYASEPGALTGRVAGTSLWPAIRERGWEPFSRSMWRSLLIFHYQQGPLQYHWFGLGFDPGLDAVVAFLALHGLVETLRHPLRSRNVLLLAWLAVGLVPAVFSTDAPRGYRALLASPPLYVFAALPLARLLELRPASQTMHRYVKTVAALLLLAVPVIDFNYYFYRLYTHPSFHYLQATPLVDMATELRERGPRWTGFVLADTFDTGHETLRFLSQAWGLRMRSITSLSEVLPIQEAVGSALFMMTRGTMDALPALTGWYRGAESDVRLEPQARDWLLDVPLPFSPPPRGRAPTVAFVAVPDLEAAAPRGVVTTFLSAEGAIVRSAIAPRPELRAGDGHGAHVVRWATIVAAPRRGRYRFSFLSAAEAKLWVNGTPVVGERSTGGAIELTRGPHFLLAEATIDGGTATNLLWQPPSEGMGPIPERQLFTPAYGLTVERRRRSRSERQHDPYPYYVSFARPDARDESLTWTGRLRVPPPHARRLRIDASGGIDLRIDGESVPALTKVRPGVHDVEIRLLHPNAPTRFTIWWQERSQKWDAVPWESFAPPGPGE